MTHSVTETMRFVRLGREHWKQVMAGSIDPVMPEEFNNADEFLQQMFAKGAVEEMSKNAVTGETKSNFGSDWPKLETLW